MKTQFTPSFEGQRPARRLLGGHPLARKLAIVTVIKLVGLAVLWWAFFSGHGQGPVTADQTAEAMLHPTTRIGNTSR